MDMFWQWLDRVSKCASYLGNLFALIFGNLFFCEK